MRHTIRVYDPTAACHNAPHGLQKSFDAFAGKTVGFIDNTKPNFSYLVDDLAELLNSKYGVGAFIKRRKRMSSQPASEAVIEELSKHCDIVITGSGD